MVHWFCVRAETKTCTQKIKLCGLVGPGGWHLFPLQCLVWILLLVPWSIFPSPSTLPVGWWGIETTGECFPEEFPVRSICAPLFMCSGVIFVALRREIVIQGILTFPGNLSMLQFILDCLLGCFICLSKIRKEVWWALQRPSFQYTAWVFMESCTSHPYQELTYAVPFWSVLFLTFSSLFIVTSNRCWPKNTLDVCTCFA